MHVMLSETGFAFEDTGHSLKVLKAPEEARTAPDGWSGLIAEKEDGETASMSTEFVPVVNLIQAGRDRALRLLHNTPRTLRDLALRARFGNRGFLGIEGNFVGISIPGDAKPVRIHVSPDVRYISLVPTEMFLFHSVGCSGVTPLFWKNILWCSGTGSVLKLTWPEHAEFIQLEDGEKRTFRVGELLSVSCGPVPGGVRRTNPEVELTGPATVEKLKGERPAHRCARGLRVQEEAKEPRRTTRCESPFAAPVLVPSL